MNKKIILCLILCFTALIGQARNFPKIKPVKYSGKGCDLEFSIIRQDSTYYLIATFNSRKLGFLPEPIMQFKTFEGDVNKVYSGYTSAISQGTTEDILVIGNTTYSFSDKKSTALFVLTPEQCERLRFGVSKIRLSTMPTEYEYTFKKDKIGRKLYVHYLEQKYKDEDF